MGVGVDQTAFDRRLDQHAPDRLDRLRSLCAEGRREPAVQDAVHHCLHA